MGKLITMPHPVDDKLPNETLCECGAKLGDHSHIGLFCPVVLGRTTMTYSRCLTFKAAAYQDISLQELPL